ncbi:hypothetical protein [Pseudonocardia sp.]|uniref:hypothetical protein n=1 Tax=Pseudonocardia sp. TaxID=60912 RepID=UPI003D103CB9
MRGVAPMINLYLSGRSLAAARSVDPQVSPAAGPAAGEVAIVEQLREGAGWAVEQIPARADRIARGD